jgi:hypothetical protein
MTLLWTETCRNSCQFLLTVYCVVLHKLYCLQSSYVTQLYLLYKDHFLTSLPYICLSLSLSHISSPLMCFHLRCTDYCLMLLYTCLFNSWHFFSVATSKKQVDRLSFWNVLKVLILSIGVVAFIIIVTWKYFSAALSQYSHFVFFRFPHVCLRNSGLPVYRLY